MDSYGFFKHLATQNCYTALTHTLNSAACTIQTKKTLKRITLPEIQYAHMGQLILKDGVCYATFLQNPGTDTEHESSDTSGVVLAIFSLARVQSPTFDPARDVEYYLLGKKGDTCDGYVAASIFKDNSMCLVGDRLYICFSFITEDGRSHIFSKVFHIGEKRWGEESVCTLCYRGEAHDFSDETIARIFRDKGISASAKGLIELVSAWSEYEGEYYATGITMDGANNGFVVKTKDFRTMELVDAIPFNDRGTAEVASYIREGRLYVACRQDYGVPYLYLGFLDLKSLEWKHFYKVADGNARPWFFEHRGELYLLYTVEEIDRRYANLARVRTTKTGYEFFDERIPIEIVATIKDCGFYFATAVEGDRVYFVSTKDTESFGELSMDFYDPDEVNERLLELFQK